MAHTTGGGGVQLGKGNSGSPGKDYAYSGMPEAQGQPVLDTASSGVSPGVQWGSQPTGNREGDATPSLPASGDPMSAIEADNGTRSGGSTDIVEPGIEGMGLGSPGAIFKGSKSNG